MFLLPTYFLLRLGAQAHRSALPSHLCSTLQVSSSGTERPGTTVRTGKKSTLNSLSACACAESFFLLPAGSEKSHFLFPSVCVCFLSRFTPHIPTCLHFVFVFFPFCCAACCPAGCNRPHHLQRTRLDAPKDV